MLIERFYLPAEKTASVGLQEINMPRLGRYVALAGKNGAGKSRLLTILEEYSKQHRNLTKEYLITLKKDNFKVLRFVPKGLQLKDPRDNTPLGLNNLFNEACGGHIESYHNCCLAYIQKIQDRWWNVTHQDFPGEEQEIKESKDAYNSLSDLIEMLLEVKLARNSNSEAVLFGKPFAEAKLSDGQKVILQLAVALHAQKGKLDNTVFILDELENHLHPSITIDLLKKLDQTAPNAQIWIATHSVSLLAYIASIEPMSIWYMDNGKVTHSGRHPECVLKGLLGDDERIGQVHAFTGLPAFLAATTFAVESLLPPKTIAAEEGDPQINQISKILKEKYYLIAPSILDYGAGKGRLLEGIASGLEENEIANKINYMAFDLLSKDKDRCCAVIADYFDSADDRYFGTPDDFFGKKDNKCIDVIIMCNVLHEIPPSQWLTEFSSGSLVMRALKEDGFLLIVEDQRIPVGEKAHEHGFLILDTPHLKTLFNIKENDIKNKAFMFDDYRNDGRLKAHLIAKSLLKNITTETRRKAIEELMKTAQDQIKQVRKREASYANGLLHGFWAQQFTNAYMFVNEN